MSEMKVPVVPMVERRICNAKALGSNPNGHILKSKLITFFV